MAPRWLRDFVVAQFANHPSRQWVGELVRHIEPAIAVDYVKKPRAKARIGESKLRGQPDVSMD
jgi:hypothetical protein